MCPVLKLHFLVYLFHGYVLCCKVYLTGVSAFMDTCPVLKLDFLVYMFHGYVPCSKVTLLSVYVWWICVMY